MYPKLQNPFVVGTPIVPERFVGRKSLIAAAFDQINNRSHLAVCRVSASKSVALDTDKKLKALSKYQFFIQNRTNCRK